LKFISSSSLEDSVPGVGMYGCIVSLRYMGKCHLAFFEHCAYSKIFSVRLRALVITWCVHNESARKNSLLQLVLFTITNCYPIRLCLCIVVYTSNTTYRSRVVSSRSLFEQ
jgi:hypothetical protein